LGHRETLRIHCFVCESTNPHPFSSVPSLPTPSPTTRFPCIYRNRQFPNLGDAVNVRPQSSHLMTPICGFITSFSPWNLTPFRSVTGPSNESTDSAENIIDGNHGSTFGKTGAGQTRKLGARSAPPKQVNDDSRMLNPSEFEDVDSRSANWVDSDKLGLTLESSSLAA
jgi:hypothetical protein